MSEDIQIWKERIQAAEKSGLSIKAWCEQAGVRKNKYFYWRKKISELDNTDNVNEFVDVTDIINESDGETTANTVNTVTTPIQITLNTLTITINNEADIDVANSIIERIYKLC